MKVGVFGLGYVGMVTATILATEGCQVVGIDANADKVSMIRRGESPVLETEVDGRLARALREGSFSASTNSQDAVIDADVVFVCVGTPSRANGQLDMSALRRVVGQIGTEMRKFPKYRVVVIRSTVLPHLMEDIVIPELVRTCGTQPGDTYGLVLNPEFLREGSSVDDFLHPPFTLIGEFDPRSGDRIAELYGFVSAPLLRTTMAEAAMVKYASNAFHATKIAFANEIGLICQRQGIDSHRVMDIFCRDEKLNVSPRYLRPGFAFGGSCLPKDLRALTYHARREDVPLLLLESVLQSNHMHVQRCLDLVLRTQKQRVGVFGISFKPGTDDLRESPMIPLVEALIGKGFQISVYDRHVSLANLLGSNREYLEQHIPHIASLLQPTMEKVVEQSEVLVVAHQDPEFSGLRQMMKDDQILIDFSAAMPGDNGSSEAPCLTPTFLTELA